MGSNTSQLQLGRLECANWSHRCMLVVMETMHYLYVVILEHRPWMLVITWS